MRPFERYFHRRRHERARRAPSIRHVVDVTSRTWLEMRENRIDEGCGECAAYPVGSLGRFPETNTPPRTRKTRYIGWPIGLRSPFPPSCPLRLPYCEREINDTLTTLRARIDQMRPFNGGVELCGNGSDVRVDLTTRSGRIRMIISIDRLVRSPHCQRASGLPFSNLSLDVNGVALRIGPGVFYQVNLEINALLVQRVLQSIVELNATHVLDLFSGMGNFGIPLARKGVSVTCVEQPGRAIEDCNYSVRAHGLEDKVRVLGINGKKFD